MSVLRKIVALLFVFLPVLAMGQVHLEGSYDEASSTITVTMTNDSDVAGIQFDLVDTPDAFSVTGVTPSFDNASDFTFSSNADGTIIGFSLSGAVVASGTHTLCVIDIDLTGSYTEVTIENPVFADGDSVPLSVTTGDPIVIGEWVPTNDVYVSFGELDGNTLPIMINSNVDIYGFQFKISDMPEALDIVDASGGAAQEASWTVNSSADGVILGFTFSLDPISAGNQVLTNLELGNITGLYTEIYFDDSHDFVFSDMSGVPIQDVAHGDGFLWGELPDVPNAPMNLEGETLGNSISLSWDSSDLAESYNVYRNGMMITSTGSTFYTDSGLNFGTEYSYNVTAENISGESGSSNVLAISTEDTPPPPEPQNLTVTDVADGSVSLAWEYPDGHGPVWDGFPECPDGSAEYVDCVGTCFNDADCTGGCLNWIGDTYCDDGTWGLDFQCDDYGNDCGDCPGDYEDPYGICGDGLMNSSENPFEKTYIEGIQIENFDADTYFAQIRNQRDLVSYNVKRSTQMGGPYDLIHNTADSTTFEYTDNSVVNGTTYYYVVTSQFDAEGESLNSNEVMATPMGTTSFTVSEEAVVGGDNVSVTVTINNPDPASSVNFTLSGDEDLLSYVDFTTSGFPEDWTLNTNLINGNVTFSGFGNTDVSAGATVTFTYSTSFGMPTLVELCTFNETVDDTNNNEFFVESSCGSVDITLDYSISLDVNVTTESADIGEAVEFELLMDNSTEVYGVEFIIGDNPNNITNVSFDATGRIPADWDFTADENVNGQIVVMGSGSTPISAGDGALFTATSTVDEGALASVTTVYYAMAGVVDNEMNYLYIMELLEDTFEVFPGHLPPAMNLVAEGGLDSQVPLTWDAPAGGGNDDGGGEECEDFGDGYGGPWYDSDGPEYDCAWYESMGCPDYGDTYANFGYNALEACCACGGGTTGGDDGGGTGGGNDCESLDEFQAFGVMDLDGDGVEDDCFDPGDGTQNAYFVLYWNAGCEATGLFYNGAYFAATGWTNGPAGMILYGVSPNTAYDLQLEAGSVLSETITVTTGDCPNGVASSNIDDFRMGSQLTKDYSQIDQNTFVMPESRNANREANYTKAPVANRNRELIELFYHDGNPTNGYYQSSVGYGVVYDLSEYGGASIEMVDFSHYGWSTADGGDYNLFVVNMDNGDILYETNGTASGAMSSNVWVEGIGLGGIIAPSNQIGVFMQPLTDHSAGQDDWYPCLDSDGATGSSNSGIYDFTTSTFTQNANVGNFLMDLWIDATPTNIDLEITGYNVFRSDDSGANWSNIATSDTESYLDEDVTNGQEYQYYVTVEYEGMYESGASNVDSAVPSTWVTLELSEANILSGTTGTIDLSMSNQDAVSGFEIDLIDIPNNLILTNVTSTERVPDDWTVNFNENNEGNGTLLAFSFQGTTIDAGEGPVFVLEFEANAAEPTEVQLCTANEVITDTALPFANEFPVNSACSNIFADVEGIEISLSGPTGSIDQGATFDLDFSVNNPYPIYGFEIHIEDAPEAVTVVSGTEGDRLPAGGMFSVEENDGEVIIIWFSLTLTPIDAGDGSLFSITYEVNEDATDGDMVLLNITDESVFSDDLGNAMYYREPDFHEFSVGAYDAIMGLEQFEQNSFKVLMSNDVEVSGFQFKLLDDPDEISFSSVSFGNAECTGNCIPGDWSVSGNESTAGGMNILGFSFQGTTIDAGNGAIMTIEYDWTNEADSTEICFGTDFSEMTDTDNELLYMDLTSCATLYNVLSVQELEIPTEFELVQNHPNPFNPTTTINFSIPEQTMVTMKVFDLSGRLVKTLVNGQMNVGHHSIDWNGVDTYGNEVAAGIYIYTLEGKDLYMSRKMILMK